MKYFKVKKESDNVKIMTNRFLVKNELYTPAQINKFSTETKKHFDEVEINRKDTYWFFGARFCSKYPYNS